MTHDATTAQLSLAMDALYNNQFLFSDHYLDALLPRDPRWEAAREEAAAFHAWLCDLYEREGDRLEDYSENQLEEHWFKPIFERLGHVFETQASVPGLGKGIRRPDYAFFPTEDDRQEAAAIQKTEAYAQRALAVGEVKQWGVNLSKKQRGGGTSFDRQNPSYQIDYYLKATGLTWGILANGRQWRLVHQATSYRLDTYYEVDLLKLLEQEDAGAIRYFYLFFRQAAFRPDDQGRVFLDDVLAGSEAYALALEEDLQENAYRALELLMQGFLDFGPNNLTTDDLQAIYDNSLYLLYRLLFILYGESRGLLPTGNPRYREFYSFGLLKKEIAALQDSGVYIGRRSSKYYDSLNSLFHLINGADPNFNAEVNIVRYNGGLFDPQQHPFLKQKSVGDWAFTRAVDLLCRRETATGKEFADYRTLNVRHLGSIYEGLLEYQPCLAAERMVAIREGKGEQWLPASDAPQGAKVVECRAEGEIYLETDKGERKATGSYYTPQYIVAYIVEQTLGPLVAELRRANGMEDEPAVSKPQAGAALVEGVLDLKVLDPAMGSGHFLVEATDYLARALATDPYVETDAGEVSESDLNHWRRRVVERCIYGVDKNPLAVELAKLSLWLNTFASDKPLGFLDHHLKCGDSLVGATVESLGSAPPLIQNHRRNHRVAEGQMNMFAYLFSQRLPVVMSKVLEIVDRESDSYETVRAKEAANRAMHRLKAPFQAIANLWTSAHFGVTYTPGDYQEALNLLHMPEELFALEPVQAAEAIADERRFFHWELTFPEIFFDRVGAPLPEEAQGFDAVIGNPPYGMTRDPLTKQFVRDRYKSSEGRDDVYKLFTELALLQAKSEGYISYITPNTILTNLLDAKLRKMLLTQTSWMYLITFGYPVFEDPTVHSAVFVVQNVPPEPDHKMEILAAIDIAKEIAREGSRVKQSNYLDDENYLISIIEDRLVFNIVARLEQIGQPLGTIAHIRQCIKTGDNSTYLKTAPHPLPKPWIPVLEGSDVQRYQITWPDRYLKYGSWLARNWQNPDFFERPKIVVRETSERITASLDQEEFYLLSTLYSIYYRDDFSGKEDLRYLLTLLNSQVAQFYMYHLVFSMSSGAFIKARANHYARFPIPRIDFTTPEAERTALVEQAIARYEAALAGTHYTFTADQPSDVIHDLLAHLAERMIALNREKQQRIDAFYLDLEGVTDADTYASLQKGKQGRTLWKAKACRPYVEEGSYTTHSLEESLGWTEDAYKAFVKKLAGKVSGFSDLVGVYRDHALAYAALVQRIAATDRIIDQIVYQLYGLTEEEIAIVEGEEA